MWFLWALRRFTSWTLGAQAPCGMGLGALGSVRRVADLGLCMFIMTMLPLEGYHIQLQLHVHVHVHV